MAIQLRVRKVARTIVLNHSGEVLLVRHSDTIAANPLRPELLTYWVAPGGGLREGETSEQAAIREFREETGIQLDRLECELCERQVNLIIRDELMDQREFIFLARIVGRPEPVLLTPEENIVEHRWWPLAEIETSTETFFPDGLVKLIRETLEGS